ncbi:hypothetical protein N325_03929, partial [Colius striatus]
FSPAVKTFSQKAKAVPGLCSYSSDIAGKDPLPQTPSKSQGFTNREKMLPRAFCTSPEQPSQPHPASPLQPSPCAPFQQQLLPPGSTAVGYTPPCNSP